MKKRKSYWDSRKAENILDKNAEGGIKELTSIYKRQNKEIENAITSLYVELLENGEISTTKLYEYNRLKNIMSEINNILGEYGKMEQGIINKTLENAFNDVLGNSGGYESINFSMTKKELMASVVNTEFKGKNFSKRIWNNRDVLSKKIQKQVQNVVGRGLSKDKAVEEIMNVTKSSFNNADRLVRTETMRVINDGQKAIYKAEGRTHGYYIYTNDDRTCDLCRSEGNRTEENPVPLDELDGVHHPRCRCTIVPEVGLKSKAKSGIMKEEKNIPKINGISCGKPMSFKEANSGKTNPYYGTDKGYSINCQTCVPVFEARQRGYNVVAKPNKKGSVCSKLSYKTNLAYIDPLTGTNPIYIFDEKLTTPKRYLAFIKNSVKQDARYSIEFDWKGKARAGHIVNLDMTPEGLLRIKDNQRGIDEVSEHIGDSAVLRYLSKMKYTAVFMGEKYSCVPKLLRIDNVDFDFDIVNEIMEGLE